MPISDSVFKSIEENKHFLKVLGRRRSFLSEAKECARWWQLIRKYNLRIRYETLISIEVEILRYLHFEKQKEGEMSSVPYPVPFPFEGKPDL